MGAETQDYAAIFLPGLMTKGRSKRLLDSVANSLKPEGISLNIFPLNYPSHQNNPIQYFFQDESQLEITIRSLKQDFPLERIGLIGACYGSYLTARYLANNSNSNSPPFAILAEPYFGIQSLSRPYKILAKTLKLIPHSHPLSLPTELGKPNTKYINITDLLHFIGQPVNIKNSKTPILGIATENHHFFNAKSVKSSLQSLGAELAYCPLKGQTQEIVVQRLSGTIKDFLLRVLNQRQEQYFLSTKEK